MSTSSNISSTSTTHRNGQRNETEKTIKKNEDTRTSQVAGIVIETRSGRQYRSGHTSGKSNPWGRTKHVKHDQPKQAAPQKSSELTAEEKHEIDATVEGELAGLFPGGSGRKEATKNDSSATNVKSVPPRNRTQKNVPPTAAEIDKKVLHETSSQLKRKNNTLNTVSKQIADLTQKLGTEGQNSEILNQLSGIQSTLEKELKTPTKTPAQQPHPHLVPTLAKLLRSDGQHDDIVKIEGAINSLYAEMSKTILLEEKGDSYPIQKYKTEFANLCGRIDTLAERYANLHNKIHDKVEDLTAKIEQTDLPQIDGGTLTNVAEQIGRDPEDLRSKIARFQRNREQRVERRKDTVEIWNKATQGMIEIEKMKDLINILVNPLHTIRAFNLSLSKSLSKLITLYKDVEEKRANLSEEKDKAEIQKLENRFNEAIKDCANLEVQLQVLGKEMHQTIDSLDPSAINGQGQAAKAARARYLSYEEDVEAQVNNFIDDNLKADGDRRSSIRASLTKEWNQAAQSLLEMKWRLDSISITIEACYPLGRLLSEIGSLRTLTSTYRTNLPDHYPLVKDVAVRFEDFSHTFQQLDIRANALKEIKDTKLKKIVTNTNVQNENPGFSIKPFATNIHAPKEEVEARLEMTYRNIVVNPQKSLGKEIENTWTKIDEDFFHALHKLMYLHDGLKNQEEGKCTLRYFLGYTYPKWKPGVYNHNEMMECLNS